MQRLAGAEQTQALAELAAAWARSPPIEDAATRTAIAEGLAQANRDEFVAATRVEGCSATPAND